MRGEHSVGKLAKLKDLASRAGRWLGLATTPVLHTTAVAGDRFDQMTWRDTYDQAAALRELERTRPYVDANRVAVWGWSGGGSNTLNLMFRSPELYNVGMAVAPVPDDRLYDTIYQERYMGLPQDNPAGYKASSPINFAEGLRGNLLLIHGSGDDNVHYQGSEILINRLIELGKQFDFMEYPGRTHAIQEGAGTRFHLYSLLARYLETHVQPGPAAR